MNNEQILMVELGYNPSMDRSEWIDDAYLSVTKALESDYGFDAFQTALLDNDDILLALNDASWNIAGAAKILNSILVGRVIEQVDIIFETLSAADRNRGLH